MFPITGGLLLLLDDLIFCASHVSGNTPFEEPLSAEEEKIYVKRCAEGDEEAERVLIKHNLRLVAYVVKKYSNSPIEYEDLISIGTIGLIKAVKSFDPDKGVRLATYAVRCINNEILMALRVQPKGEVSLNDTIGVDKEGNEMPLSDILGTDPDDVLDRVELNEQTRRLYRNMRHVLKERERMVLELRYGLIDGGVKTQKEIAQMLGISRSYVSRIEKAAIEKLRKAMS